MSYQSLAFFTGLFGSLHCMVMCGPLVMALPFPGDVWYSLIRKLIYQAGRIGTYTLLGLVAGTFGGIFNILGLQQVLSLVSAATLIIIAITHFSESRKTLFYITFFTRLAAYMAKWLGKPYGGLIAGALHGLIPCGMVYMAIAGSVNTGTALKGAIFMAYFGLGTTPLLLLASILPLVARRFKAPKFFIPVMMMIAGILLIIRSLNADISYLNSPVSENKDVSTCQNIKSQVLIPANSSVCSKTT